MLCLHFLLHVTNLFLMQHRIKSATSEANWDLAVQSKSCYLCINQSETVLQKIRNDVLWLKKTHKITCTFMLGIYRIKLWDIYVFLLISAIKLTWVSFLKSSEGEWKINREKQPRPESQL